MIKKLLFITTLFAMISCSQSPQEKVNALIELDLKKSLYHPETYDPAETIVDSAFTPFDNPSFYEKTIKLCKLGVEMEEYEYKIKNEKSDMAHYKDMLQIMYSNSGKESYDQAKGNYEKYLAKKVTDKEISALEADFEKIVNLAVKDITRIRKMYQVQKPLPMVMRKMPSGRGSRP